MSCRFERIAKGVWRPALLFAALFLGTPLRGVDEGPDTAPLAAEARSTKSNLRLYIAPEFARLKSPDGTYDSVGGNGSFFYGFCPYFGAALSFSQGFNSSAKPTFSEVDVQVKFPLTGTLISTSQTILVENKKLVTFDTSDLGGWRLGLHLHKYFFDFQTPSYIYPGLGASVSYEFPSDSLYNWTVGTRFDSASTSGTSGFYAFQIFIGIGLSLQ